MAEICDVYDHAGRPTGRTFIRGTPLGPGQYQMAANLWIFNGEGRILIQKRAAGKKFQPGVWAAHGGGMHAGETTREACTREAREEIGIRVDPAEPAYLCREESPAEHLLVENFVVCREFDIASAALQPGEVSALRWAATEEIRCLRRQGRFFPYRIFDRLADYVARHIPAGG